MGKYLKYHCFYHLLFCNPTQGKILLKLCTQNVSVFKQMCFGKWLVYTSYLTDTIIEYHFFNQMFYLIYSIDISSFSHSALPTFSVIDFLYGLK